MRRKKKSLAFIILLLIACFGIGYAYLTTTLSINGVTDVDSNTWNIYWSNIQKENDAISEAEVLQDPTIDASGTTVSFHIRLREPGEHYSFLVDAVNDGTIDAMVESISKKVNGGTTIPAYLNYTVTYEDGGEIAQNHLLAHESLETLKVRVEYRTDINPNDLPTSAQSLTLSFDVEYVQADENAGPRVMYSLILDNDHPIHIGDTIPTREQTPYNYSVSNDYLVVGSEYQFFTKHYMSGNLIQKNSLVFYYNNILYELLGGDGGTGFERNKQVINNMVTALNINFNCNDYDGYYHCVSTVYNGQNNWNFSTYTDGRLSISKGSIMVAINADGSSQTYDIS